MSLPLIGILVGKVHPLRSYQSVQEEIARLMIFSAHKTDWKQSTTNGLILEKGAWVKKTLPLPAAVYNCRYSSEFSDVRRLEESMGVGKIFNLITKLDKWETHQILASSTIKKHLPQSELYSEDSLIRKLKQSKAVIVKPRRGHLGQDINLIKIKATGEIQLFQYNNLPIFSSRKSKEFLSFLSKHLASKEYLIQQFIPLATINNRVFDLRLLLQKDFTAKWSVTATLSRIAVRGYFVTNVSRKIISVPDALKQKQLDQQLLEQLTQLSIEVAQTLERHISPLGELSVDFGLDEQNNPWLIEVNGMPSKDLFLFLKKRSIMKKIYLSPLEYAYFLATH